jgi:outer membrane protein assembly factor BamB
MRRVGLERRTMTIARRLAPCLVLTAATALASDWPQFLGPNRDATTTDARLVEGWLRGDLRALWRAEIGEGYSGVAVVGDRLFGMDKDGADERLFARRSADGTLLWTARTGRSPADVYGGLGPRGTPALDGERVFALGAQGDLLAVEAQSGRIAWRRALAVELGWRPPAEGTSSSPLVADGRVYVLVGGSNGRGLAALDRETGRTLWTSQDDRTSYASPVRWDAHGVAQVLFLGGTTLFSVDPSTGRLLWKHAWPTYDFVNAATPLVLPPDRVFVSSGYDQGAALLRVRRSWSGGLAVDEVWRSRVMRNHFNNSVHHDGVLYGFDEALLAAVDAGTGERLWRERGFGKGSIVRVGRHLVVLSEEGELALLQPSREGARVLKRQPALNGRSWTPPSVAGGRVFLRGVSELVCLAP